MAKVVVYTTNYCPFCHMAEKMLRTKDVDFERIDVANDLETRKWLVKVTGQTTVPQIFIDEQSIGGFSDMQALDQQGKLDSLLG